MLESKIQSDIVKWLKQKGYFVIRNREVEPIGFPDLSTISPIDGAVTYIEVKQADGRLSPAQSFIHTKLRTFNCKVYTVSSLTRIKEIFNETN